MSSTTTSGSTLGVLTRQEIRNYLKHKLFWFGAAITVLYIVLIAVDSDETFGETTTLYMIAPAAALGVLGLVTMFGLTRRSDRAAEAAGAVAVPERTRTLALASAVVVPASLAFVAFLVAVVFYYVDPPESHTVWPEISDLYVHATQFGGGVMCAIGGPLLGLLLARYLPKRGVAVVAAVVLVLITILMQGLFEGGQPYRVFWFWTYFHGPYSADSDHWTRLPGNPFIWVAYLAVVCVLGVVTAVYHDPESSRPTLKKLAFGLLAVAIVLGVLSMTVGYPEIIHNPLPGEF